MFLVGRWSKDWLVYIGLCSKRLPCAKGAGGVSPVGQRGFHSSAAGIAPFGILIATSKGLLHADSGDGWLGVVSTTVAPFSSSFG